LQYPHHIPKSALLQTPVQEAMVGGIPTPLKNISQMGVLFPTYGKIKFMFQTTKQGINWINMDKHG